MRVFQTRKESWFGDHLLKMGTMGLAVFFSVLLVLFISYQGLSRSVFFQIEKVDIKGCKRTTPAEILAWSGLDIQTNLWTIRTGRLKEKLEADPWIARAEIDKNWPNRVAIRIRERKAVAILSKEQGLFFVDRKGVVFAEVLATDDHDYPIITVGQEQAEKETTEMMEEALAFIRFAGDGSAAAPKQNVSEIHLAENGDLTVFMADHPVPISMGRGEVRKKYHMLSKVLSWLYRKEKFEAATSIDMNYMAGHETVADKSSMVMVRF